MISVIICDFEHILPIIQNNGYDAIHSFKFAAFGVFLIAAALFFPENILSMVNYDPPLTQEDVENLFSIIHRQNARIDEQVESITTRNREYSQVVTDRDHLQNAVVPGLRDDLSVRSNALEEINRIST